MNNKYPLTSPQKLIYDMQKFAGGSIATICGSITIKGSRDTCSIKKAVNEMYRLNDAMRIHVVEEDGVPMQFAEDYVEKDVEILRFENKAEMDNYAQNYAREPMDFDGDLCRIKAFVLNDGYGIIAKLHHIISDAWTLTLVASQFYALSNGEMPETHSYFDFLESDKTYLESPKYQNDKEHFITEFEKCEEVTYLSDKRADSLVANRKTIIIPIEETAKISNYAKANGSSVFMLLMTVVGTYLNRIKMNTERLYIGTAMLNRFGYDQKNTMGMFVNTAPVLVEIENDKTFSENLAAASKKAMQIMRHQKYNYGELLKELRTSHNFTEKLYDVMISYQNAKITGETVRFESEWYPCGMQTESLQIHIDDRDSEGILKIHYDYQSDKFTEEEIERIHNHIFNLLFDAINDDTKKPYELDILSNEEKQTLLHDFNDTKADYPKDKCVHQLFEEQVLKTPDKTAVIACDKTLTYDELNRLSNRIANSLIEKGVKPNDIVAFALPRTSMLIATMFGILKSGAAYMPIDPDYPKERIDSLLSDSNAKFFITKENLSGFLCDDESNPKVTVNQNNYYCTLHTSGSTGKPKLAVLTHKNLMSFLYLNQRFYEGVDSTVSATVVTFDAFILDTVLSISLGVKTILSSEEEIYNQSALEKQFEKTERAMFFATPTKLKNYIVQSKTKEFLKHIAVFIVGGEVFSEELHDLISLYAFDSKVYNIYGPTESTICATTQSIDLIEVKVEERLIKDLTAISKQERQKLLYSFNDTKADYPKDKCVHQLFEEQVKRTSDKTAVIACDKTLSYDELNRLSNRIANSLIEKGVKPNDIIAFALPRTSMLIATMFGILKSGAAYMPLDPDYPKERIDSLLSDANAKFFITKENTNDFLCDDESNPNVSVSQSNYYCALHTSGSTGKPKLAVLTHKNLMAFLYANQWLYEKADATVSATGVTFDAFILDTVLSISSGVKTILSSEEEKYNQSKFESLFGMVNKATFFATPTKLKNYIIQSETKEFLKHIGVFVVGGEVFTDELYQLLVKHTQDANCYNGYGPTETTLGSVFNKVL